MLKKKRRWPRSKKRNLIPLNKKPIKMQSQHQQKKRKKMRKVIKKKKEKMVKKLKMVRKKKMMKMNHLEMNHLMKLMKKQLQHQTQQNWIRMIVMPKSQPRVRKTQNINHQCKKPKKRKMLKLPERRTEMHKDLPEN